MVPPDNRTAKIDLAPAPDNSSKVPALVLVIQLGALPHFTFLHIADTDLTGHV